VVLVALSFRGSAIWALALPLLSFQLCNPGAGAAQSCLQPADVVVMQGMEVLGQAGEADSGSHTTLTQIAATCSIHRYSSWLLEMVSEGLCQSTCT
jgi:hypothetical protein